jgi:hypothetical protein
MQQKFKLGVSQIHYHFADMHGCITQIFVLNIELLNLYTRATNRIIIIIIIYKGWESFGPS